MVDMSFDPKVVTAAASAAFSFPAPADPVARWISDHSVTVYPQGKRGLHRKGERQRKEGERYASGRLKPKAPGGWKSSPPDPGHEMTLLRRAEFLEPAVAATIKAAIRYGTLEDVRFAVGQAHKSRDQRASYVLGRLDLERRLADRGLDHEEATEQSKRRHDAGVRFGKYHFWLFGPGTAPSHMKNLLTGWNPPGGDNGDDMESVAGSFGTMVKRAKAAGDDCFRILEQVCIFDVEPASPRELRTLRRGLAAIANERRPSAEEHPIAPVPALYENGANLRPANDNLRPANDNDPAVLAETFTPTRRSRRPGLDPSFTGMRPSPAAIAAAVARLKASRLEAANDNEALPANDNGIEEAEAIA